MKTKIIALFLLSVLVTENAMAFCGFYVAKADTKLFNKTSQIILVRDGNRTTITMNNDFQGDVKDFAMVVPVPVVLKENDIRISDQSVFEALDAYSGPRLVEYYDENPCYRYDYLEDYSYSRSESISMVQKSSMKEKEKGLGVKVEAEYSIGEYDILILSATESVGLKTWLTQNGYKIPGTANEVLDPYIKSNMKFFVVKVNLDNKKALGFEHLRPIQISFDSPKFMLPIRLGMANANGPQDMIVYAFTKTGRVECTNYRTVKIPTDRNVPLDIRNNFGKFYVDLFEKSWRYQGKNCVFLEYAWNVTPSWGGVKCDPCVGPPPLTADLGRAGVNWANQGNVFFTRLHVRYSRDKFPQDLNFQVTPNTEHFQGRYILTNPAGGDFECEDGQQYLKDLCYKRKHEVEELAVLTGWDVTRYGKYITEYNHLIKDNQFKKNDFTPVIPQDSDPGSPGNGGKWIFTLFFLVGVGGLFILLQRIPVTRQA
ncbi:MAG: DUF2330 domain-containing protein [Flavobacteriales bacterium]|nr:DUF2330 domain-containing protein [Flavobacteriales bacterium]